MRVWAERQRSRHGPSGCTHGSMHAVAVADVAGQRNIHLSPVLYVTAFNMAKSRRATDPSHHHVGPLNLQSHMSGYKGTTSSGGVEASVETILGAIIAAAEPYYCLPRDVVGTNYTGTACRCLSCSDSSNQQTGGKGHGDRQPCVCSQRWSWQRTVEGGGKLGKYGKVCS
jgi:hypothetical protein